VNPTTQSRAETQIPSGSSEDEYQFLTTPELTDADFQGLCDLFEASFEKAGTPAQLREKYTSTALGYSFHAFLRNGQAGIVGSWNAIPQTWRIGDREVTLAVSVDTMIHPAFRRDPLKLWRLAHGTEKMLKAAHIPFVFGFPNDNSYVYMQQFVKWKPIGELPFHILPLRPGSRLGFLKPLDGLFSSLVGSFMGLLPLGPKGTPCRPPIERVVGPTLDSYKAVGERKLVLGEDDSWLVYSVHRESNGLQVAFLVDFHPISRWGFHNAIRLLLRERTEADALAYVGTLPFKVRRMVRLPSRFVPKPLRLSGKVLLDTPEMEHIQVFSRWHLNLSSFDVR